jgi:hypothetical protein
MAAVENMTTFCLAGLSTEKPAFGDIEELRTVDVTEKKAASF